MFIFFNTTVYMCLYIKCTINLLYDMGQIYIHETCSADTMDNMSTYSSCGGYGRLNGIINQYFILLICLMIS